AVRKRCETAGTGAALPGDAGTAGRQTGTDRTEPFSGAHLRADREHSGGGDGHDQGASVPRDEGNGEDLHGPAEGESVMMCGHAKELIAASWTANWTRRPRQN